MMTAGKGALREPVTILFDLDGTLIDSTEAILESFRHAFDLFEEVAPADEEIKRLIGHPLDVMFESLGAKGHPTDEYVAAYKEHYRLISREKTVPLPGAKEAVEEAAEFALLGVVTTKTARYSVELLEHMGLMDLFEVLVGREDVDNPKPHPEPIFKALDLLERGARNCWMVGDTLLDVDAAKAAGVTPFALTCGYGDAEELAGATEHLAEDAVSAVKTIRRLCTTGV